MTSSYCEWVNQIEDEHNIHRQYHDQDYGFPLHDDNALFGRLILEINQAGLNWQTILNKRESIFQAYANFNISKVAAFNDKDIQRLLNDKGIIRNRLKIQAAIYNAQQILLLQQQFGSFLAWLNHLHPLSLDFWIKAFKKQFKFVGPEIVNEFLMSTGYLVGAHSENCPIYQKTVAQKPAWLQTIVMNHDD